jgi:hypothetical protein
MLRPVPVQVRPGAALRRRIGFAWAEAIVALALFASLCALVFRSAAAC